jgi:hypothetical protein
MCTLNNHMALIIVIMIETVLKTMGWKDHVRTYHSTVEECNNCGTYKLVI